MIAYALQRRLACLFVLFAASLASAAEPQVRDVVSSVVERLRTSHDEAGLHALSEADVLALVLAGASDRRVAAALGIAPSTARTHVRAVLRKTGAGSRRELRRRDGRDGTAALATASPSGLRASDVQIRRASPPRSAGVPQR